ncbi:hypothetical protein [Azonexus hydrophilus]|uniref:hypothetical protein n=1 Tax=Azonexus hydrophilus TaxID=418702 RepID=UPI001966430A|nr:hypothetical protein [Azonexus hydrophilus]
MHHKNAVPLPPDQHINNEPKDISAESAQFFEELHNILVARIASLEPNRPTPYTAKELCGEEVWEIFKNAGDHLPNKIGQTISHWTDTKRLPIRKSPTKNSANALQYWIVL